MQPNKKKLILIVDDNPQNIQILGNTLTTEGYEVGIVQSGDETFNFVKAKEPDLILLDIMMPHMDGYEVCAKLKATFSTRHIPIIFLTAKTETEEIIKGFATGGVDYITKPFNSAELLARVKTHIEMKHLKEFKAMQEGLARADRLAATGKIATTVAHEINSPLQGILTLVELMKNSYRQDKELLNNLELISTGFNSIKKTVKKLMDLSRPGKETKQLANINEVIKETVILLQSHLKKSKIKSNLILSSEIPNINASPSQISHVFLNLINNAVDAMNGKQDDKELLITSTLEKNNIIITLQDSGPGISIDNVEHIFDPFYTTKKAIGMGIGLYICDNVIKDHNGSISVENIAPTGACFTIVLPID